MSEESLYLRRLTIRNFRPFAELTLDLPDGPGLTVIHGPNGLGKSSLFDAIEWGLTDEVQRLNQAKVKPAERERAIRRAGSKKEQTRVAMEFSDSLRLERTLLERREKALMEELVGDPNLLVRPDWSAPDTLTNYLQFTHFLGQSAPQRFINKDDKERLKTIVGPARLDEIQNLGEKLLRLKKVAIKPLNAEVQQALLLAQSRLDRWGAALSDRTSYAALAQASQALDPDAVMAEASSIAADLVTDFGAAPIDLSASVAEESLATAGAMIAERKGWWEDRLRTIEAAEQTLTLWEAVQSRQEPLHAEQAKAVAAGTASGERLAHLTQTLADLRAAQEGVKGPAQAAEERLGQMRALNDLVASAASIEEQLGLLQPLLQYAEQKREQADSFVQQAEASRAGGERALSRWRAAMDKRDRARMLEERSRRFTQHQIRRVEADRAWLAVEPSLNAVLQREAALTERQAQCEHDLVKAQTRQLVVREQADTLHQAVATIAAQLSETDALCPVCGTPHEPAPLLKQKATAQASKHHAPLAELEQQITGLQTEREALNQSLVEVQTERRRYETDRTAMEEARRLEERSWAELAAEPELAGQQRKDAATWVSGLSHEAEAALEQSIGPLSAAGDLASLAASVEAARAHLADVVHHASLLVQQRAGLENDLRTANARLTAIVRQMNLGADWRQSLEAQTQDHLDQLTDLRAKISAFDHQIADVISQLDTEQTTTVQVQARLVALSDRARAAEAERENLTESWRKAGLEEPISRDERTRKLSHAKERLTSLEGLKGRHDQAVAGLRAWLGQTELRRTEDELAKIRSELGLEDDDQVENKLRHDFAEFTRKKGRLESFERHADTGYQNSKNIGEVIQNKTLLPLNSVISRFCPALMPEDHQIRLDCRFGHGQGASITAQKFGSAINPELYLSEGQLAALNIALLMSASVTYPWSRWRALLMDDPLHHNDVIHASAFMDVVCNLILHRHYQVVLSTHDSAEAEYFLRKARNAGIQISSRSLLASSS